MNLRFKSIKDRLMALFLLMALLPLVVVSVVIYKQRAEFIRNEAFDKLKAIRDLKVDAVNSWIDERMGDVQAFCNIISSS